MCLSIILRGATHLSLDEFSRNLVLVFFENLQRKFEFHLNLTEVTGTLNKDQCLFIIMSLSAVPRMRNVSDKIIEKIKTHFMFSNFFSEHVLFMRYCGNKCIRAGQATDDNRKHAHCFVDN